MNMAYADVTNRKLIDKATDQSQATLMTILNSMDSLAYVADMETHEVLFINRYGIDIFGDLTGTICWKGLQQGQSGPCSFCTNDRLLDSSGEPTGVYVWEFKNTTNNNWYECRDQAVKWIDGRLVRIEFATDITARKLMEDEIRHLAHTDPLTGVANRNQFHQKFNDAIKIANRQESITGLLMLDLDGFKSINDNYGHPTGDALLNWVAESLQEISRETDTIARLGGDEFAVIVVNPENRDVIRVLAERIINALSVQTQAKGYNVQIGVSIGGATFPDDGSTLDDMIVKADKALYAAKMSGGNKFLFFESGMRDGAAIFTNTEY